MKIYDNIKNSIFSFISLIRKNKKRTAILSVLAIFIFVVTFSIISSLARVGFNMNVVVNQDIPEDAWFTKLTHKKERAIKTYSEWDGSVATSFAGGDGTINNPYLISNVSEFLYLDDLLHKTELLRKEDDSVCTNNYLTFTSSVSDEYKKLGQVVYQAEEANISGGANIDDILNTNDKFVGYIGYNSDNNNTGVVTFNVDVEKSGNYLLDIYYISLENRDFQVRVNNGSNITVNCAGNNADWNSTIMNQSIEIYLNEGSNTISFSNSTYFAPNLDRIGLTYIESSVSELDNNHYYYGEYSIKLNNTSDTDLERFLIDLDLNGDTILDITVDGLSYGTNLNIDKKILKDSSVDIIIEYASNKDNSNISNLDFYGYDEDDNVYMVKDMCYIKYYESENTYYKITNNLDFKGLSIEGIGDKDFPFEGIIDGGYHTIKNLVIEDNNDNETHHVGLFNYVNNARIKNFLFEDSKLELNGTGANYAALLVGFADGESKIYNNGIYSGDIIINRNSTNNAYVGSLVGYITGKTVVANSYSYADFKSTGNNNRNLIVGGLVGYRNATSNVIDNSNPFVYLLVYYGSMDLKSVKSYQYVYNGTIINASSTPTYCYYLWLGDTVDTNSGIDNTYAILKSYDDIIASGFNAHLNNYRYMVNYYVGNSSSINNTSSTGFNDIATWYTSNSESIYPIIKKYSKDVNNSHIHTSKVDNSIKVNLVNSSTNEIKTYYIEITEKNEDEFDYTNHKIVLPYNSVTTKYEYGSTGKLDGYDMTLTGWKLTSVVQDGTTYSSEVDGSKFNYDYTLRSGEYSASKDIGTIYAQGGFYLVPDGVSEITLTAKWAYTIYAADEYNDMVYLATYEDGNSSIYGRTRSSNESGLTKENPVYTLNQVYEKVGQLESNKRSTIYDVVVMLVGNLHFSPTATTYAGANVTSSNWAYTSNDRPITFMSIDNDLDLKPDYALYTRNIHDQNWPSLRFDFVSVLQIPQVGTINAKLNAMTLNYDASFEVTETVNTDRIDLRHYQAKYVKLNAGYYDIYALWLAEAQSLRKNYIYFGGYAKAIYLTSGIESRQLPQLQENPLPVFVITGGRIETLSATYFGTVVSASNDVFFYVDGGYIDKFYTTYNSSLNKSANVVMNDTYVNTYYAGGHTESAYVYGGVTTDVVNSRIGALYGGPEYGTVEKGSVINIQNSEIDKLFGSGYGGTQTTEINLVYQDSGENICSSPDYYYNIMDSCSFTNSNDRNGENRSYCFGRTNDAYGIETAFYSTIYSKSGCASKGFATYYSSLSAANVDHVFINIKDSVINEDFYGGGNKGIVDNSIVINMENTTIKGDLYGGGLSNETETLEVYEDTTGYIEPEFISYTVDVEATYPQKVTYTWSGDESKFNNSSINKDEKLIYSENDGKLGNVNGEIYINIKNSTIKGNLYGGGNLSEVNGNININLSGENNISGSIYGGGNKASVTGNTDIRLDNITIDSVYGGGNIGDVFGTTSVTVLNESNIESIYGGGNQASVTTSNIYVENGNVENVFGGSNSSGEVSISNVYTGTLNPVEASDGSHITVSRDEPSSGGSSSGGNSSSISISGPECSEAKMSYSFTYDPSTLALNGTLTNNSNVTFNTYTIRIKTTGVTGVANNWSGTTATYEDGYIVMTEVNQWYGTNPINALSTRELSNNSMYLSVDGDVEILDVEITAIGSDGVTYTTTVCDKEEETPPSEPDDDEEEDIPPSEPNRIINASVGTIYGGNNLGGKTSLANIFVENSKVINIFGGGNLASTDYTNLVLGDSLNIEDSVYGGGNYGIVNYDTSVVINDSIIGGSAYAGGNGTGATVIGNTYINVGGSSVISGSLFGGGNAAETGTSSNNDSVSTTVLSGGNVSGSVYGGANTSKIWGIVKLYVGDNEYESKYNDIVIGKTLFGGGEANATGSTNYDYSYISVTKGIDMYIDKIDQYDISVGGSIFGSGNASSTSGYSNIYINNLGTRSEPKRIVSLQRAGVVELINSSLDISGTTDRTNEFNNIIYSLSRIDKLNLVNNSTLYIESGTNVVKELSSYYDNNGKRSLETVSIDGDVTQNVDNRLYMYINKAFNIIDSENLTNGTFGKVNGMMFLGLYEHDREYIPDSGIYKESYKMSDTATTDDIFKFMSGSYVMGLHMDEHDITKNGFYTNYIEDEKIKVDYIDPTPEDAVYYQWIVGEASQTYQLSLTASKFATMGTDNLPLLGFEKANSYFEVVSFNDNNLESGISLKDEDEIPRVAKTNNDALTNFGLKMTSGNVGWITDGETSYLASDNNASFDGTSKYITSNSNDIPSLDFYFIHSKNITEDKKLGTVVIGMLGYIPIDEVTYEVKRVFIEVTLDTKYYETDSYESSMTPGKEYELFVNNKTNITSDSSLSAYFSLFVNSKTNIYKDGFYRVLTSNYKLPVNTRITMIDRTVEEKPVYYYYVVTNDDFNNVKSQMSPNALGVEEEFFIYPLSKFIRMDSLSDDNNYNDTVSNSLYYNSEIGLAEEEFIFIVDYDEADLKEDVIDAELLLELKDEDDYTNYDSLGVSHANMVYSIYASKDSSIDIDLELDRDTAYQGYEFNIDAVMNFVEPVDDLITIKDTNYTQDKMGLKISMYDSNNNKVNGTSLMGTIFYIDGVPYSARLDGSVRVHIADFVTNVEKKIRVDLEKSMLATDRYKIVVESFGSPDGIYYGLTSAGSSTVYIDIVNENYGISVDTDKENIIIDKDTGFNKNNSNKVTYNIGYTSQFSNPSIRVKLMRRSYSDIYSKNYELVDLGDYILDELELIDNYEYAISQLDSNIEFSINLKDNLKTGTYKVVFMLYNNDTYIDEVSNYIIIK